MFSTIVVPTVGVQVDLLHMSHSLKSSKGVLLEIIGEYYGGYEGGYSEFKLELIWLIVRLHMNIHFGSN